MGQTKSLVLLAGAALSLGASAAMAQQTGNDEIRATVAEMMADAETRSSLLSAGDAGHDGRFFIAGDGFRLNVGGQIQARYYANFSDASGNNDGFESGFELARVKLNFQGDINKDWFYRVRGDFATSGGDFGLDYGYAGYKFANGSRMTMGQFKLPLLREELVGDDRQLAVERSVTNHVFTQGYSQGIMLDYETESWRVAGAFSDGLDTANTGFTDNQTSAWVVSGDGLGEADYAFTGRFEYMFSGGWKMFDDFTSAKGQDFGCLLGVAAHWQESANTNNPTDVDTDTGEFTVDLSLEGDSWNIYGAFIYRYQNYTALGTGSSDQSDYGWVVQAGWRFAENTEIFGRYDGCVFDSDNPAFSGNDTFNFLTFGLNQYYAGHAAKATVDVLWALDGTAQANGDITSALDSQGLIGQSEDNEVVIRAQFQLLF
jgi:hypothetical protein